VYTEQLPAGAIRETEGEIGNTELGSTLSAGEYTATLVVREGRAAIIVAVSKQDFFSQGN
jgi:hypothetical protein